MLSEHCKICKKKDKCDNALSHPYDNRVWHSCKYKNEIVAVLLGIRR